jgi:hypothetical protein
VLLLAIVNYLIYEGAIKNNFGHCRFTVFL